jgi:hypothetical protein
MPTPSAMRPILPGPTVQTENATKSKTSSWNKATEIVAANLEDWKTAKTPSGIRL